MHDHEIPTHMEFEDKMLLGLTGRQVAVAIAGFSCAAGTWATLAFLPVVLRAFAGSVVLVAALALALLRPGGEGLEEWLFAWVRFHALPARAVWQSVDRGREQPFEERAQTGFIDLDKDEELYYGREGA